MRGAMYIGALLLIIHPLAGAVWVCLLSGLWRTRRSGTASFWNDGNFFGSLLVAGVISWGLKQSPLPLAGGDSDALKLGVVAAATIYAGDLWAAWNRTLQ